MARLSDHVMRFVADQGVRHVFAVTGGGAMHLNDSLANETGLTAICNAHEQASAICAEGYAKATGGLGVAMVTTGPGGTNAVTGVAGAWLDSTPVLFISGQVKRPDRMFGEDGAPLGMRQLGVQEVDIVSIVKPITKYAVTVLAPEQIRFELEQAVYLARSGRPGPVWVDIPLDVQAIHVEDWASLPAFTPPAAVADAALAAEVAGVIAALNRAERPLLFAGNGIRLAGAEAVFQAMREVLRVPVAATWCAADLVASDDPLYVGRPGAIAARGANFALQNCDFLLSIGVRLDFAITGYAPEKLARAAHRVAVDIDPAELRKLAPHIQQPILSDAKAFLDEMLRQAGALKNRVDLAPWRARCAAWKTRYDVVTAEHRRPEGRVSTYHLAQIIGEESAATDQLVSGSSGSGIEIFLLACPTRNGQRIFHTAGLGSMGFGIPTAIAVSIATGRKTICVDGDGGFQFNIQELETVARLNLPIKFFVLNNDGYASIRASQANYFGQAKIGCDAATGISIPNLCRVAAAYGIGTAVIEDQTDLRNSVRRVLDMTGPVVCDVRVLRDEVRAPRLSSVQLPDGRFVSKPLEDLWPFLPREEFLANMIIEPLADG
jgi:acetolactate synthase-1/2/3 large subunit